MLLHYARQRTSSIGSPRLVRWQHCMKLVIKRKQHARPVAATHARKYVPTSGKYIRGCLHRQQQQLPTVISTTPTCNVICGSHMLLTSPHHLKMMLLYKTLLLVNADV